MEFKDRLIKARKYHKLSRQELADRIGIHVSQYGRYENGNAEPSMKILTKLCQALKVTADELLFGKTRVAKKTFVLMEAMKDLPEMRQQTIYDVVEALIQR